MARYGRARDSGESRLIGLRELPRLSELAWLSELSRLHALLHLRGLRVLDRLSGLGGLRGRLGLRGLLRELTGLLRHGLHNGLCDGLCNGLLRHDRLHPGCCRRRRRLLRGFLLEVELEFTARVGHRVSSIPYTPVYVSHRCLSSFIVTIFIVTMAVIGHALTVAYRRVITRHRG